MKNVSKIVGLLLIPIGAVLIILGTTYEHWLRETTPTLIKQQAHPVYRIEFKGTNGRWTQIDPTASAQLIQKLKEGFSKFLGITSIEKIRLVLTDDETCCREDMFGLFKQPEISKINIKLRHDIPKATTYEISSEGKLTPVLNSKAM